MLPDHGTPPPIRAAPRRIATMPPMATPFYDSREQRRFGRLFRDVVRARELMVDLVRKDLRARYRYALMGFLWAVLEPVALMVVLTFVFSFVLGGSPMAA